MHEPTEHLLTQCNYAEAVWNLTSEAYGLPYFGHMSAVGGPMDWVKTLSSDPKKERKRKLGVLEYIW
jgi:hypothetical protein